MIHTNNRILSFQKISFNILDLTFMQISQGKNAVLPKVDLVSIGKWLVGLYCTKLPSIKYVMIVLTRVLNAAIYCQKSNTYLKRNFFFHSTFRQTISVLLPSGPVYGGVLAIDPAYYQSEVGFQGSRPLRSQAFGRIN